MKHIGHKARPTSDHLAPCWVGRALRPTALLNRLPNPPGSGVVEQRPFHLPLRLKRGYPTLSSDKRERADNVVRPAPYPHHPYASIRANRSCLRPSTTTSSFHIAAGRTQSPSSP